MFDIDEISELIYNGYLSENELDDYILYLDYIKEDTNISQKIKDSKVGQIAKKVTSNPITKTVAGLGTKVAISAPTSTASYLAYEKLKSKAVEHAGKQAASAVGNTMTYAPGVVAGAYVGYKLYKHFKNKKRMNNAHKEAVNEAMKNIEKTHPSLSVAAKPHVQDEASRLINMHKDEFKKNPQDIHKKIVDHFKSDDFKNKMIQKTKE